LAASLEESDLIQNMTWPYSFKNVLQFIGKPIVEEQCSEGKNQRSNRIFFISEQKVQKNGQVEYIGPVGNKGHEKIKKTVLEAMVDKKKEEDI
jgi:hypothetical protein